MSTETAPQTDAPAPEADVADIPTPEAEPQAPQSSDDMLDSMIAEAFDAPDAEDASEDGPTTGNPPRDEQGRFKKVEGEETETPEGEATPEADVAEDAETQVEETPAERRILKAKVDKEVHDIDIDEWWAQKPDEFAAVMQKGLAADDIAQRRYNSGVQDIVSALSAQGYGVIRDNLAPGGVRVVPPAATTPQETQQAQAPEADDPVTMLGQQITELEARIEQAPDQATTADFLRLNQLQRQLGQAQAEAIRAEQAKFRKAQEDERAQAQQKALQTEFARRVGGLIQNRTKNYGDYAEEFAADAQRLAWAETHNARTIEDVESALARYFDRMDRIVNRGSVTTPTPVPTNGKAPQQAATTPPAKTPPPAVGTTGARSGVGSNNKLSKAKTLDDLDDEDWQRIALSQ